MTRLHKTIERVRQMKRTILSLLAAATVLFGAAFLVGFAGRQDVELIIDGQNKGTVQTFYSDPVSILKNSGYEVDTDRGDLINVTHTDGGNEIITLNRKIEIAVQADGGTQELTVFSGSSVETALEQAGVTTNEYDIVSNDKDNEVADGEVIVVTRKFGVNITADGVTKLFVTPGNVTVAEAIERCGIKLNADDSVNLSLNYILTDTEDSERDIVINRVVKDTVSETVTIPSPVEEEYSSLLPMGDDHTTPGEDGTAVNTYAVTTENGTQTEKTLISTEVQKQPVPTKILHGTAFAVPTSKREFNDEIQLENGIPKNYQRIISGKSTCYIAPANVTGTASGRKLQIGTVAVDPRKIPYGSLLYIVSKDHKKVYGTAVAADTGGFIYTTNVVVDVFVGNTMAQAMQWQARNVDIYVINQNH